MTKRLKIISLIMAVFMTGSCLVSCTGQPEEGTIEDVEIAPPAEEELEEGIFTRAESPYDYEYKTFYVRRGRMAFEVPAQWDARAVNSRYVRLETPAEDPFLPGATINILCGYGEDVSENEMSEYTLNNHAYTFSKFFEDELPGLSYTIDGRLCRLRRYVPEDSIDNGLAFVDSEHAEDAATLTSNNVVLVDKASNYYTGCSFVATYVKWDDAPFCFSTATYRNARGNAKTMLEYMASSIRYIKDDPLNYGTVSYEDFSTSVPAEFSPVAGAENIFSSSLEENRLTAGMTVGVFKVDEKETLTADNIAAYYGQTIGSLVFEGYGVPAAYTAQAEVSDDGPDFTGRITVNAKGEDTTLASGSVFGLYSEFKTDYYVKEKGDAAYLIAVIYQERQKDIAREIGLNAVRKFKVD